MSEKLGRVFALAFVNDVKNEIAITALMDLLVKEGVITKEDYKNRYDELYEIHSKKLIKEMVDKSAELLNAK